ncbi:hypothetical protein B5F17_13485 [Butyricicoccus pullicaecorum]|uniref:Uncharacterized protein n=1 Tax=Butyricicoccus pullicaecorum TaxID=501571 RepID=A0A1Y4L6N6_9FIRM|nr:hypothetical protein B5F17_13485 [Butyricicoccus pullicaecorum]
MQTEMDHQLYKSDLMDYFVKYFCYLDMKSGLPMMITLIFDPTGINLVIFCLVVVARQTANELQISMGLRCIGGSDHLNIEIVQMLFLSQLEAMRAALA